MYMAYLICLGVKTIKTLIIIYRFTFYAVLNNAFGERVQMLYTDTDLFIFHDVVEDLAKESRARFQLRYAVDFSKMSNIDLSYLERSHADFYAGEVDYYNDKTK